MCQYMQVLAIVCYRDVSHLNIICSDSQCWIVT